MGILDDKKKVPWSLPGFGSETILCLCHLLAKISTSNQECIKRIHSKGE